MNTIRIIASQEAIKPGYNFTFYEFWKPTLTKNAVDFDCPECLVDGMQVLRDWYNEFWETTPETQEPWEITSFIRPYTNQGFHFNGHAGDSLPENEKRQIEAINQFKTECLDYQSGKGSTLIEKLRQKGVNGFGIEVGRCIHLDFRPNEHCHSTDQYGNYCVFSWEPMEGIIEGKSIVYFKTGKAN